MSIKILFLLHTTRMDGATISFINLINGMKARGVKVIVAYPDRNLNEEFYRLTKDVVDGYYNIPLSCQVINNQNSLRQRIKNGIKRVLFLDEIRFNIECKKLGSLVNIIKPDIIATNVGVIHSGYIVSKKYRIPHVWHIREYQTKDFNWSIVPSQTAFISMLKNSNVITITEDILKYFGLNKCPNAKCIYNGCFSNKEISFNKEKQKYFLSCSRISEEKNILEIIDAFALFANKHQDYTLKIAGTGDKYYVQELRRRIYDKGIGDKVEFLGYVSNVKPLMDYATGLIVASRCEGFGRMTAEAAFRGCLVIGKNTGGTREILSKTGGFLYNGGAVDLYNEMEKIVSLSSIDLCRMVHKAQHAAKDYFSIERNVELTYAFYLDVLKDNKIDFIY